MGQKSSCAQTIEKAPLPPVKTCADPWSLIITETVHDWNIVAGAYGFPERPYKCVDRECDRDSVCLKRARVTLKRHNSVVEVQRFKQTPCYVRLASQGNLHTKVLEGYRLRELVAAMKGNLVVIVFYHWQHLQYEAVFALLDVSSQKVLGCFQSSLQNMTIVECRISPDGACVAVLFYFRRSSSLPFQYDVYLFSTETFEVLDTIACNTEVRPYFVFDPRYKSTRLAIVNFTRDSENIRNALVLYCTTSHKIIAVSHVMLSVIYGGGYFCVNYSQDGRYLILQKITDNMHGVHCYADSYVFNSDSLKLVKYYYANLQAFSTQCDTNYAPVFSACGSRMYLLSEEASGSEKHLKVSVYQLPWPLHLQEQCRIVVLKHIRKPSDIACLPLPRKLMEFLRFKPYL